MQNVIIYGAIIKKLLGASNILYEFSRLKMDLFGSRFSVNKRSKNLVIFYLVKGNVFNPRKLR